MDIISIDIYDIEELNMKVSQPYTVKAMLVVKEEL
jgi:hypothetical protein